MYNCLLLRGAALVIATLLIQAESAYAYQTPGEAFNIPVQGSTSSIENPQAEGIPPIPALQREQSPPSGANTATPSASPSPSSPSSQDSGSAPQAQSPHNAAGSVNERRSGGGRRTRTLADTVPAPNTTHRTVPVRAARSNHAALAANEVPRTGPAALGGIALLSSVLSIIVTFRRTLFSSPIIT